MYKNVDVVACGNAESKREQFAKWLSPKRDLTGMKSPWSFHSAKGLLETIEVMLGCMLARLVLKDVVRFGQVSK